ncbi:16192_t:CDS:2, partial [Entrophospora sp. SA101]
HLPTLLEFHGTRRWHNLRFKIHIKKQKACREIVTRITGGSPRTVVAYGDEFFSSDSPELLLSVLAVMDKWRMLAEFGNL